MSQYRLGASIVGTFEPISYLNEPEFGESTITDGFLARDEARAKELTCFLPLTFLNASKPMTFSAFFVFFYLPVDICTPI